MCGDSKVTEKIDIMRILQDIGDYILVRKNKIFPRYTPGSDVDLLVPDRSEALRSIHDFYARSMSDACEMKVSDTEEYCHVDFIFNGTLDLRLDLVDSFQGFHKFGVKPSYMIKLFKDRKSISCESGKIYVPSDEDELTLRYFAYLEWFDRRPDKIKHLDYISSVDNQDLKRRFFENTHKYIQFRPRTWNKRSVVPSSRSEALYMIKSGLAYLFSAVLRRLRHKTRGLSTVLAKIESLDRK